MLSYQLAQFDARIGSQVSRIVEGIPGIAGMPLDFQFANLLSENALRSVEWSGGSVIIVIDALDESGSETDRKTLLQALSRGFLDLPDFFRVIVVSRQEPDIQHALGSHPNVHPYALDIESMTNKEDVAAFVWHRLNEIRMKDECLSPYWPGDDKITALTESAGGLFVWASTACLYIDSYDPDQQLNELLIQQLDINFSEPFAQLDRLYKTGLQSAGLWSEQSFRSDCCNILGMILCARIPLSYCVIDALLGLPPNRLSRKAISRLGCVIRVGETEGIRILHPSFHDYLSQRCRAEPWSIDLDVHHKNLALHCTELLDKGEHMQTDTPGPNGERNLTGRCVVCVQILG
jgi:hypothetical protein